MTTKKEDPKVIGTGVLNWDRHERVSDRYGTVKLFASPTSGNTIKFDVQEGARGRLVAEVLETRDSEHIGDLFRGVGPVTPKVGERIALGEGTLFAEGDAIGLRPDDGREADWLDIHALYRAHSQTVKLVFEPSAKPS